MNRPLMPPLAMATEHVMVRALRDRLRTFRLRENKKEKTMSAEVTPVRHQARPSRRVTPPVAAPIDTTAILEALRAKAAAVLGAAEGADLVAFQVGALGNFPYVWQNPSNLEFNHLTYAWINSSLAANTTPAALDDALFTDEYRRAITAVTYQLSNADREKLNAAQALAVKQQAALLNAWVAAYGALPQAAAGQQPIDAVVSTIATTWASPATTLAAMGEAVDLSQLLGNTPASGVPILPVLAEWLGAMDSVIPLQNAQTMNTAYLAKVCAAVNKPAVSNGALLTDDNLLHPAYAFAASSSVSAIENGLSGTSNVEMSMSVDRSSASEFTVSLDGQTSFSIPVDDFITVNVSASASYFKDTIATSENTVSVDMQFSGVTLVNFGPLPFDPSTLQNWYWMAPITEAIANGSSDVTGFVFGVDPGTKDFSTSGPFGYLKGIAIANYPTVRIAVTSSEYEKINTVFQSQINVDVSFIGISLASGSASSYSNVTSVDHSSQTVTITLNPPPALIAGKATDSTAWILGVQTEYPAATS